MPARARKSQSANGESGELRGDRTLVRAQEPPERSLGQWRRRGLSAARLVDGQCQQRDQDPRQPDDDEHQLPAAEGSERRFDHTDARRQAHHRAADDQRQPGTHIDPAGEHAEGATTPVLREQVGDQRIGGRAQRGFSHAHSKPGGEQPPEGGRQCAGRGHHAPNEDSRGNDCSTGTTIRPNGDGQSIAGIELVGDDSLKSNRDLEFLGTVDETTPW
jgi:hypothetical protein